MSARHSRVLRSPESERRRSMSLSASLTREDFDALNPSIAAVQAPVAANPILPSDIELEHEGSELSDSVDDELATSVHALAVPPDARIPWIYFALGCAILLPWNSMITATPYFLNRLEGSSLRPTFNSYLSCIMTASNFVFLARATVTANEGSYSRRIFIPTLAIATLQFLLALSTYVHLPAGIFFAFVLLNGGAQMAAGSYLQTSVVAISSLFGPNMMQAVMSGQAAVGVAVSAVQVLSASASVWHESPKSPAALYPRAKSRDPEESSAFLFFGLSTLFLILCAALSTWLTRLPAYKAVIVPFESQRRYASLAQDDERQHLVSPRESTSTNHESRDKIMHLAKANIIYEIAVAYVFVVTLAVFPPITASVKPTNPETHPLLFSAVHFLVFNLGDFAGRYLCSFPRLVVWSERRLLTLSLLRTLFVPLFLICNVQTAPERAYTPLIGSDVIFMLLLLAFGLSNGYVSSMTMMSVGSWQHNPHLLGHKEDVGTAATVASFCLVGGLTVGSLASFGVRALVCQCNPFLG